MKKKILFTFIISVASLVSFGQAGSVEFRPDMTGVNLTGKPFNWQTRVIANETRSKALITFSDRDNVFVYQVDTSFGVTAQYVEKKDSLAFDYFGNKYDVILQTASGNSFCNYILKKNSNEIYAETPDFDDKLSLCNKYIEFGSKEKFLTAFEDHGHVYFLTHLKNSNELRFYIDSSWVPRKISLTLRDTLPDLDLEAALKDIKVIKESKEADLLTCTGKTKLFIPVEGPLVLTLDKIYRYTVLWRINIADSSCTGKLIPKNPVYCNDQYDAAAYIQSNSYVWQDRILQAVICHNELLMQIKDISTDSLLAQFHASRDSSISFASSGLITKDEGKKVTTGLLWTTRTENTRDHKVKDLKTKDFFKAVNRHALALVIIPQDGYLLIKTGEAHEVYSGGGGGGGTFMPGGSFGTPGGMVSTPGHWSYIGTNSWSSASDQSETYMLTALNKQDLQFVPNMDIDTKYDKIDSIEDKLKDLQAAGTAFDFNKKTWFLYWNKTSKKFMIEPVN